MKNALKSNLTGYFFEICLVISVYTKDQNQVYCNDIRCKVYKWRRLKFVRQQWFLLAENGWVMFVTLGSFLSNS